MQLAWQGTAEMSFNGTQLRVLFRRRKARGMAGRVGARGAADPVNVVFDGLRQVKIDDAVDAGDVDATRRDVGRNEDAIAAGAEPVQGFAPLRLRTIRVQPFGGVAGTLH